MKKIILARSIGWYINFLSYISPGKATALSYRFFSRPRKGKLLENQLPKVLRRAQRETLLFTDGGRFESYIWPGNEQVILLIHGWESNASRWKKMLPELQQTGKTIVALDAPAHGLSDGLEFNVPRYAEAIDIAIKKYRPVALIGHSMGGIAILYHHFLHKNTGVEKMILLGAPSDLRVLVDNYARLLGLKSRARRQLEHYFKERFGIDVDEFSGHRFGREVQIQGIIAHDEDDTVVAYAESKKLAAGWGLASSITTRGLGHSMHDENLYRQIREFLGG